MTTKNEDMTPEELERKREYHRNYQRERVARNRALPLPEGVEHGTVNAYANYSCRCDECKEAYRVYQLPQIKERRAEGLVAGDPRHGTYNGYANYGCRCDECKEANRVYAQDYRARKASS